jgi:hypothetical protein
VIGLSNGLAMRRLVFAKFRSQAQRRIHLSNCKDCLTVLRRGDAISTGEIEQLPTKGRFVWETGRFWLLETPRHSISAGLIETRLNLASRTVN